MITFGNGMGLFCNSLQILKSQPEKSFVHNVYHFLARTIVIDVDVYKNMKLLSY